MNKKQATNLVEVWVRTGRVTLDIPKEVEQRREFLITLSEAVKPLAKARRTRVNIIIGQMYAASAGVSLQGFNTFDGWKEKGQRIKKGSVGFPIWKKSGKTGKDDHGQLISYVFSEKQVFPINWKRKARR